MKREMMVGFFLAAMMVVGMTGADWVLAQPAIKPAKLKVAGVFPPPEV